MGKCVFLGYNANNPTRTEYHGCTSKNHPNYTDKNGWSGFGTWGNVPEACKCDGKNCPIYKKELNS